MRRSLLDVMLRLADTQPMTSSASRTASRRHLAVGAEQDLRVRLADERDAAALEHLARLDSALPLSGDVLVAELDGTLAAALALSSGRVIADPFRPTAGVVRVLHARAGGDARRAGALGRVQRLAPARLRLA